MTTTKEVKKELLWLHFKPIEIQRICKKITQEMLEKNNAMVVAFLIAYCD